MADEPEDTGAALGAEAEQQADETPQLSETEQLAVEMGWKPEKDYAGNAAWKPAREYILTEREISRETKKSVKHLREQVDRMAAAGTKATERALRQQAEDLNRQFVEAVENKDTKGAAEAAKGMRELEASTRAETGTGNAEERFSADNPWYGKDDEATTYAVSISQRLAAQGKSVDDQLEAAASGVRKRFPELFEAAPKRKEPAQLHAPSGTQQRKAAKGFADLPVDVKRAAESHAQLAASRFKVDPEKVKQQYAADYWDDQRAA